MLSLRSLNITIPQVSPDAIGDLVLNKTEYPEIVKFAGTYNAIFASQIVLAKNFGYHDVLFIGSNDTEEHLEFYNQVIKTAKESGFNILNEHENSLLESETRQTIDTLPR